MNVTFHSEAKKDLFSAAEYYEEQAAGLGNEFIDEVEKVLREGFAKPSRPSRM